MKKKYITNVLIFIVSFCTLSAFAETQNNILFSLKRTTYIEGEKSVSIGLRNAEQSPSLVQANMLWLNSTTGQKETSQTEGIPFIITPPLYKLMPENYYEWRILFAGTDSSLPKDRESVYLARFLLIPSVEKNKENSVSMTVLREFNFKVYYRPKTLEKLTIEEVQDKVNITRMGNKLIVNNQSPLFLSIDKLTVNTIAIGDEQLIKPLLPFGEQQYILPDNMPQKITVKWNLLDENSFPLQDKNIEIH